MKNISSDVKKLEKEGKYLNQIAVAYHKLIAGVPGYISLIFWTMFLTTLKCHEPKILATKLKHRRRIYQMRFSAEKMVQQTNKSKYFDILEFLTR